MSEHKPNLSSLNNDIIPDDDFLNTFDEYNPKLSEDIVKSICEDKGLHTTDRRV
jgi:hypothetical protein